MLKKFKWSLLILTIICLTLPYLLQASVSNTTTRIKYAGTGNQTIFPYPFKIWTTSDLVVVLTKSTGDVTQTLNTDYTVSGVVKEAGGNVTMVTAPASDEYLTILRQLPLKQETDYVEGDPFPAQSHENGLDKLVMIGQPLNEQLARTPELPKSTSLNNITFPAPSGSEPQYLRWSAGTNQLEAVATGLTGTIESGVIHAVNYGEPGQAAIEAALTAIGFDDRTLKLTAGTWRIVSDLSIPTNINLRIERGAVLDIANGKTLTINGTLEAGLYQIFSWTGSGKIIFGKGVAGMGFPEWWGAKGDYNGSTGTDDTAAIQACLDSGLRHIHFAKWYYLTGIVLNKSGLYLTGVRDDTKQHGLYGTGLDALNKDWVVGGNSVKFVVQNGINSGGEQPSNCKLENLVIQADASAGCFLQQWGAPDGSNPNGYCAEHILLENCYLKGGVIGAQYEGANGSCLGINTAYIATDKALYLKCRKSAFTTHISPIQKNTWLDCRIHNVSESAGTGLYFEVYNNYLQISHNNFIGCGIEFCGTCIRYDGRNNTFIGLWTERRTTPFTAETNSRITLINPHEQLTQWYTLLPPNSLLIQDGFIYLTDGTCIYPKSNDQAEIGQHTPGSNIFKGFKGQFSVAQAQKIGQIDAKDSRKVRSLTGEISLVAPSVAASNVDVAQVELFDTLTVAYVEVTFSGKNSGGGTTYFRGVRRVNNTNGTLSFATVGTDDTAGGTVALTLTDMGDNKFNIGVTGVSATASNLGVHIRVLGADGPADGYGCTITVL